MPPRATPMNRLRRPGQARLWLGGLLAAALLVAQFAGLAHQVRHGGTAGIAVAGQAGAEHEWTPWLGGDEHSCVLFDGATFDSGPPVVTSEPALRPPCGMAVASTAARQPDLASPRRFLSRAPPAMDSTSS
ncbi:hypothetical protein GCM10023144_15890 [Pigmentiphaga soli]|uniref:DUF2946 domain-containing protein n=1 Tax=Pigmentiphaga soli TaxID=1007095 RepID=A0ABP8GSE2_9BURK